MPVLTLNGNALNYEQVGDGPSLIYIAGTRFDSAKQWAPYMRENAAGFRVILPDPPGLAGSTHVASIEPRDWVDDLGALLDALDIRRVNLAAETLGTRIATRFAADHPDRVATLILNGTIAYSSPSGDAARRGNADASGQEQRAASGLSDERQRSMELHHGADWPAVNDFYLTLHARPEFHEYYDLRKVAPRVQAPTLLLRGDIDDPVHPIMHSVELHHLLPNSRLAIYPNTEFNALRARPKEAWDLIRGFVAEHPFRGELARLSPREREVAALIARGHSNRDIAAAFGITEGTAANHVEHILRKLAFSSRTQIAVWATEHRLGEL